jgi:hypothetical protein
VSLLFTLYSRLALFPFFLPNCRASVTLPSVYSLRRLPFFFLLYFLCLPFLGFLLSLPFASPIFRARRLPLAFALYLFLWRRYDAAIVSIILAALPRPPSPALFPPSRSLLDLRLSLFSTRPSRTYLFPTIPVPSINDTIDAASLPAPRWRRKGTAKQKTKQKKEKRPQRKPKHAQALDRYGLSTD